MRRRLLLPLALILGSVTLPSRAVAYVRSATQDGTPIAWPEQSVEIVPDTAVPPSIATADALDALDTSVAAWSDGAHACSYFDVEIAAPQAIETHLDRVNVVKYRTERWCRPGDTAEPEVCFAPEAAGITTVFYRVAPGDPTNGEILDADIELNAVHFTLARLPTSAPPRPGTQLVDLDSTLTHELGHFQGLDHSCWNGSGARLPDDTGQPEPACSDVYAHRVAPDVYAKVTGATMFPEARGDDLSKRVPSSDDVRGLCAIYPIASVEARFHRMNAAASGGCAIGGVDARRAARTDAVTLASVLIALQAISRRRGRARRTDAPRSARRPLRARRHRRC